MFPTRPSPPTVPPHAGPAADPSRSDHAEGLTLAAVLELLGDPPTQPIPVAPPATPVPARRAWAGMVSAGRAWAVGVSAHWTRAAGDAGARVRRGLPATAGLLRSLGSGLAAAALFVLVPLIALAVLVAEGAADGWHAADLRNRARAWSDRAAGWGGGPGGAWTAW